VIVLWLDLHLPMQSLPITTKDVSLNAAQGEMYSIQHYVIKLDQGLVTGQWFSPGIPVSSINKTGCHYIAKILLKANHYNPNPKC
jgi:hypothetical protein